MSTSFHAQTLVTEEELQSRLNGIHVLKEDKHELYEIQKDVWTGEHYLHYAYKHINLKEEGNEEICHQLLPLENDEVLGLMFGNDPYAYPEAWIRSFLRNGPTGHYVWFDPEAEKEYGDDGQRELDIAETIKRYKQKGEVDEQSAKRLLAEIDQIMRPRDNE